MVDATWYFVIAGGHVQSDLIHIGMKPGGIFERLVVVPSSAAARRQVGLDTGQTPKRGTGGVRWTSLFWHADRRWMHLPFRRASERASERSLDPSDWQPSIDLHAARMKSYQKYQSVHPHIGC